MRKSRLFSGLGGMFVIVIVVVITAVVVVVVAADWINQILDGFPSIYLYPQQKHFLVLRAIDAASLPLELKLIASK